MKRSTLVSSLLFSCFFPLFAQVAPPQIITEKLSYTVDDIQFGDIDNDGDLDILTVASDQVLDRPFFWFENQDGEVQKEPLLIGDFDFIGTTYFLEDINNDQALDIVFTASVGDGNLIRALINNGQGAFLLQDLIGPNFSGGLHDFTMIDVDQNGTKDILFARGDSDSQLVYYPNDGLGNIGAEVFIADEVDFFNGAFIVVDLDTSGTEDLIIHDPGSGETALRWYKTKAQGGFESPVLINLADLGSVNEIYFTDINQDGLPDLFATTYNPENGVQLPEKVIWKENLRNDQFGETNFILEEETGTFLTSPFLVDFDQDGDMDFFYKPPSNPIARITWYSNDGDGNFSLRNQNYENIPDIPLLSDFRLVDLNGDKRLDIFLVDPRIVWLASKAPFEYERVEYIYSYQPLADPVVVDDNQDGKQSVVVYDFSLAEKNIDLFQNNGLGFFTPAQTLLRTDQLFSDLEIEDLDGDGFRDIANIRSAPDQRLSILWGNTDRGMDSTTVSDLTTASSNIILTDFNQDQQVDILVYDRSGSSIDILFNQGNREFREVSVFTTPLFQSIPYMDVGDYNGDGRIDIVYAAVQSFGIELFALIQQIEGTFLSTKLTTLPIDFSLKGLEAIEDIKRDTTQFVLCYFNNQTDSTHFALLGNDPNQAPKELLQIEGRGDYFMAFNFNGDQEADILFARDTELDLFQLSIWTSREGTYQELPLFDPISFERLILNHGDFDGDGDQDILLGQANEFSSIFHQVVWYENLSGSPSIQGRTFWDENGNGVYDEGERGLGLVQTFLEPLARSAFTNPSGAFQYFVEEGSYQIFAETPESCWMPTTPTAIQVEVTKESTPNIDFGFQPDGATKSLSTNIRSAITRCGFNVLFWANVFNDGCQTQSGQLKIVWDGDLEIAAQPEFTYTIIDDTLTINIDPLAPLEQIQLELLLQMPGVEAIGDSITVTALAYNSDGTLADKYGYSSEIRCAYDPNDKLANPNRGGDNNYALFSETMEYTIRFQNTGNDTAFTVEIVDTIHPNLDLTTLQPLNASHDFTTLIDEPSRTVTFRFENILLPDSTTNEPLSHGYVSFSIESMEGLDERSIIENRAGIYFDFNPPIITNTVSNTLVTTIPVDVTSVWVGGLEGMRVGVYPNPFGEVVQLRVEAERGERLQLGVYDLFGKQLFNQQIEVALGENTFSLDQLSKLPGGAYLLRLSNGQQIWTGRLLKME